MDVLAQDFDLIVLPGGMPGAQRAGRACCRWRELVVQQQAKTGKFFAAICAAPALALQAYRRAQATAHDLLSESFSERLSGCTFVDQPVVVDGNCITAQGPASARSSP